MRIEELRKAKNEQPFRPFVIRMADGREVLVSHPDAVAWEAPVVDEDNGEVEEPDVAFCVVPGGNRIVIDLALVTALELAPFEPEGKAKKKGKGKNKGGGK
jgi:hypothetical protein